METVQKVLADELSFLKIYLPIWLYILSTMIEINLINLFVGYMGDEYLAGIGLGAMLPIVVNFLLLGFSSIFDVYGPQLRARGQHSELGVLMVKIQLQGCAAFLLLSPLFVAMFYSLRYIPLLGDSAESGDIKNIAERFLGMSIGLCLLDYLVKVFFKFFIIHKAMMTVYGFTVILIAIQTILCYVSVVMFKMKSEGIIFSILVSRLSTILMSMMTIFQNRVKWHLNFRHLLTRRIFQNWWDMIKIGVAGGIMLLFTTITFLISIFLSQVRGRVTVEVITISLYYYGFSISGAAAIAFTSIIQIGNALGSQDVAKIRYHIRLSVINLVAERICFLVIMFLTRRWYYRLVTEDTAVISSLLECGYVYAVMISLSSVRELMEGGILFAFGKADVISAIIVSSACLVGLPLMFLLVLKTDMNCTAFFLAMTAEEVVAIVVSCVVMSRLDLGKEVEKCAARLEREATQPIPAETDELVISNPINSDPPEIEPS